MSYHVELLTTLVALDSIKAEWQEFCATLPENTGFFSSYAFLRPYLEFHQPPGWVVAAIYNADKSSLLGVFPLSMFNIENEDVIYRACKPLATPYAGYFDFAVLSHERRQVLAALQQLLRDHYQRDLVLLGPLHDASPLATVLMQDLDAVQLKVIGNPQILSQIETRGQSFEAYCARKKSLTLPNARYQERRLRRMGAVEICLAEQGPAIEDVVLQLCQRNEEHFSDINYYRQHPEWKRYMTQTAVQLAQQQLASVSTLRLDGEVIASAMCFHQPGRDYFYLTAYDPEYARYSPSKVLLAHMIERAFNEKNIFCFGAGSYPYKLDWSQSVGDLRTMVIFFNPAARAALDDQLTLKHLVRFIRHH
jgi:CelD/BcsL family acetyltransferase involved in cellulose biosynthesis